MQKKDSNGEDILKKGKEKSSKMHKNVKSCRNPKIESYQLIHTQNFKKRGKKVIFKKLSTFST